jgi:hypothetical protein
MRKTKAREGKKKARKSLTPEGVSYRCVGHRLKPCYQTESPHKRRKETSRVPRIRWRDAWRRKAAATEVSRRGGRGRRG